MDSCDLSGPKESWTSAASDLYGSTGIYGDLEAHRREPSPALSGARRCLDLRDARQVRVAGILAGDRVMMERLNPGVACSVSLIPCPCECFLWGPGRAVFFYRRQPTTTTSSSGCRGGLSRPELRRCSFVCPKLTTNFQNSSMF